MAKKKQTDPNYRVLAENRRARYDYAIADDVGSLGLDLLMKETDFSRGGINPYLAGY